MAEQKSHTKADGTKIVEADKRLKQKLGENIDNLITEENINSAKEVIDTEGKEFSTKIRAEIKELQNICQLFSDEEINDTEKSQYFAQITTQTLSIKSNSGMFGYDLASQVARSLFQYCDKMQEINKRDKNIIKIHINALNIVYKDNIIGNGGDMGRNLLKELHNLVSM